MNVGREEGMQICIFTKKNEKLLKTSRQTGLEVQIGTTRIWEVEARGSWVQDSPELCFEVSSKNEIQQT